MSQRLLIMADLMCEVIEPQPDKQTLEPFKQYAKKHREQELLQKNPPKYVTNEKDIAKVRGALKAEWPAIYHKHILPAMQTMTKEQRAQYGA